MVRVAGECQRENGYGSLVPDLSREFKKYRERVLVQLKIRRRRSLIAAQGSRNENPGDETKIIY